MKIKTEKKRQRRVEILLAALELFSQRGYYVTTMPEIAKKIQMSVGNLYNYFSSKEDLAQAIIQYISQMLAEKIHDVNNQPISVKEKIRQIVKIYFDIAADQPQMIEYFLRIYLANREVFSDGCEGMICVAPFMTEIMVFFEEGVRAEDLRNQDFFSAFGLFMGYLGGMAFLKGENVLPKELQSYSDEIAENIYRALKSDGAPA
ncbi:TetR/AcrR family transcriptional regulator [Hydrogenimonas sp.]